MVAMPADELDGALIRVRTWRLKQALYKAVLIVALGTIFLALCGLIRARWLRHMPPNYLQQFEQAAPLPKRLPQFDPATVAVPAVPAEPAPEKPAAPVPEKNRTPDITLSSDAGAKQVAPPVAVVTPAVPQAQPAPPSVRDADQIARADVLLREGKILMQSLLNTMPDDTFYGIADKACAKLNAAIDLYDAAGDANRAENPKLSDALDLKCCEAQQLMYGNPPRRQFRDHYFSHSAPAPKQP